MPVDLSLEQLSIRTGESPERLRDWHALGLIGQSANHEFEVRDVARAEMIRDLLRLGVEPAAIAKAAGPRESAFRRFLAQSGTDLERPLYSVGQAAELTGLEIGQLRRLIEAMGIYGREDSLDDDDIGCLQCCKIALDAGYPEDGLVQVLRVYGDALGRAAEATQRTTHFYMYDRMKALGLGESVVSEKMDAAGEDLSPLLEPTILYFLRQGMARAQREDALFHLARELGVQTDGETTGQLLVAVVFVDLSSFTPLAEAMGDEEAADVLQRFSSVVRRASERHRGRVVKQIGDAFMMVFADVRSAIACSLEIEARAEDEPRFPAVRSGVHWGAVLYREGDYVGTTVNVASRLATEAERHQVLVTSAVRQAATGLPGVKFVRLGNRRLKGIAADEVLFEVRPEGTAGTSRVVDPVCGMELGSSEVAATLSVEGLERCFCSDECLRKFVASPERYASGR